MISDDDLKKIINSYRQIVTSGSPMSVYVPASEICKELLDARAKIAELEQENANQAKIIMAHLESWK
jgi:hypothetical protein